MLSYFQSKDKTILCVQSKGPLTQDIREKLQWLFGDARMVEAPLSGCYVGPRREMITPWSTNAVEITQNMGITGIERIEEFAPAEAVDGKIAYDPMLQRVYEGLDQDSLTVTRQAEPIRAITDLEAYNQEEGLALSEDEINYLKGVSERYGRPLTDSEVFGFSQVNSEHCRHKIFNGTFVIDGQEKEYSLFKLIKRTTQVNPNDVISAYKDNVAFKAGPVIEQFAPRSADKPDFFRTTPIESVISLKAETHNFPTTVEPFNGAATGTGGEIRDRLGGGRASLPIAGTAVYMTSYPRNKQQAPWEVRLPARPWLYQTPEQILIKASNGASDFGNKFGQPLICGSLLTFEHEEDARLLAYDKVIMLAGGVGYAKRSDALKGQAKPGEQVVLLGGDNYRIGMGGGAVSSVDTGKYSSGIELNAVQRANPEMQKRAANVIRALAEAEENPIVSIHDHGAGGHLNCLSELVEETGGHIDVDQLPVGDPTLSAKEIIGNESQERMGLLVDEKSVDLIRRIADRERSPMYVVGQTTNDMRFVFEQGDGKKPLDMDLSDFFGHAPKTVMTDETVPEKYQEVCLPDITLAEAAKQVMRLEAVACKDWLTNKVDRSVTGKVARQQCQGELQLPLSDLGAVALDYQGVKGIATSIGHAPQAGLIDPAAGSVLSIAEALTNIVFAPLEGGLQQVSLSANWMWPCRQKGEDARLYRAVEACSDFATDLGINIPTGKDSLSMTQKYGDRAVVAPGTVIISAAGQVSDVKRIVSPVLVNDPQAPLYHVDFSFDTFHLGGSALCQTLGQVGMDCPTCTDAEYFADAFNAVQSLINKGLVLAGHDISAGGLLTTLLEMCFANQEGGLRVNISALTASEASGLKVLFSENPGVVLQTREPKQLEKVLQDAGVGFARIAVPQPARTLDVCGESLDIDALRDAWYETSYLLDRRQSGDVCAKARFSNYKHQPLQFLFPSAFNGKFSRYGIQQRSGLKSNSEAVSRPVAAIIREKGTNGDREMAYSLYLAGFEVKDVHMTDLASGRESLHEVQMIVFCGGFSNSDVLGSAKGWAGGFRYNERAKKALEDFYAREDTLSLGICNGCQLMVELGLIGGAQMLHNDSHKFESSFLGLTIPENNSVMFRSLSGSKLGVWVAHGEGKFRLLQPKEDYQIIAQYSYADYPANPNGSDYAVAGLCSADGRHLCMMPHLERAIFPWQWGFYPASRVNSDQCTPWLEAFVNARNWCVEHRK